MRCRSVRRAAIARQTGERFALIETQGGRLCPHNDGPALKEAKPKIYFISTNPPPIGGRVKVWHDKKDGDLMIEDASGRVHRDIYGVPLSDVEFTTETTPRGAVRRVAIGNILAIPPSRECSDLSHKILVEAGRSMEFHWHRDKAWPYADARQALIEKSCGGFSTSYAVDPR